MGAEAGAAEPRVGILDGVRGGRVPPDHHVRIGPERGDVVAAADDDVLRGQLLEQLVDLRAQRRAVAVADRAGHLEHRPGGVADHVVQFPSRLPIHHGSHSPRAGTPASSWSTAARALLMQAGMPTPSKAAPDTARPGTAATDARTCAIRSTCPTAYCGSPPPHRVTRASTGAAVIPSSGRNSRRTRSISSPSSSCSGRVSPIRPTDARSSVRPSVAIGHFCGDSVMALVTSRSPDPTSSPLPGTPSTAGKANVTIAMLALSTAPSPRAAPGATDGSRRAALAAGAATTTDSASMSSDAGTAPHSRANLVGVRVTVRTVTPVRTAKRPDAAKASGNRPRPPRTVVKIGVVRAARVPSPVTA